MSIHPVQWLAPEPLWIRFGNNSEAAVVAADQYRPALLRFTTDDFMDQIIGTLARDPAYLGSLLARPETWRTPPGNEAVEKDMAERIAVPGIVQTAVRKLAQARPRTTVKAVEQSATAMEKQQQRVLPLKLYQPAHQRYYLVSASFVCRVAGMPDRAVARGGSEQMGFVLRRLLPEVAGDSDTANANIEFAYVMAATGGSWHRVGQGDEAKRLVAGEELLPLFPLGYRDAREHPRTLWTGLVPVGRREEYLAAVVDRSQTAPLLAEAQRQSLQPVEAKTLNPGITARMTQFKMEVAEPWKILVRSAYAASVTLAEWSTEGLTAAELEAKKKTQVWAQNLQWQMQSWLILLDFADFLAVHLSDVWNAVTNATSLPDVSKTERQQLLNWLDTMAMTAPLIEALRKPGTPSDIKPPATSLREALRQIVEARTGLEGATILYGETTTGDTHWPGFHFLLAGIDSAMNPVGALDSLSLSPPLSDSEAVNEGLTPPQTQGKPDLTQAESLDKLTALVVRALEPGPEADAPPLPFALQIRDALAAAKGDVGQFVVRYVHLKRDCGPLHPPTVSDSTQRFQLASFFDPDAPARPIQVTLPLDTTPAGLRKYNKNTAFVISDVLCGQIQRAKGLGLGDLVRSVLPWPLHKDLDVGDGGPCTASSGINIGMICSLSIPIITICALILLIIIVSLLDFIFRWLPYFIICFPVLNFSGKPKESS